MSGKCFPGLCLYDGERGCLITCEKGELILTEGLDREIEFLPQMPDNALCVVFRGKAKEVKNDECCSAGQYAQTPVQDGIWSYPARIS